MPRRTMHTPVELALARAYGRLTGIDAARATINDYFTARNQTGDAVIQHDLNVLLDTLRVAPRQARQAQKSVSTNPALASTIDAPT